jgi:hypothetical protein
MCKYDHEKYNCGHTGPLRPENRCKRRLRNDIYLTEGKWTKPLLKEIIRNITRRVVEGIGRRVASFRIKITFCVRSVLLPHTGGSEGLAKALRCADEEEIK